MSFLKIRYFFFTDPGIIKFQKTVIFGISLSVREQKNCFHMYVYIYIQHRYMMGNRHALFRDAPWKH